MAEPATPPADAPPEDAPPNPADKPPAKPTQNLDELPEWAREAITSANKEAAGYRVKVKELEPLAAKAKELEEAGKTETQKLAEDRDTHKGRADTAEGEVLRLRVALRKGLTETQAKRLVGTTEEELEADANELLESFGGKQDQQPDVRRRPREALRPGAVPSAEPEETDPAKLAALVPRSGI